MCTHRFAAPGLCLLFLVILLCFTSVITMLPIRTLLCTKAISPDALIKLQSAGIQVHYFPENKPIPADVLSTSEVLFTDGGEFNSSIESLGDLPKLRHIQMASAGANGIIATKQMREYLQRRECALSVQNGITLAGASGTHVLSIPNYVVACVITLFHQLHTQIITSRVSYTLLWRRRSL